MGPAASFLKVRRAKKGAFTCTYTVIPCSGTPQSKLTFLVGQSERVEALQAAKLRTITLAEAERLDDSLRNGHPLLIQNTAFEHQGGGTLVQIMRREGERDRSGDGVGRFGQEGWRVAFSNGK